MKRYLIRDSVHTGNHVLKVLWKWFGIDFCFFPTDVSA